MKHNESNGIIVRKIFKTLFIFVFLLPTGIYSQNSNEKKIDSLLQLADHFIDRNHSQSLTYANKASKIAEKEENSSKKAWSYFYIAKSLIALKHYQQCFHYIDKSLHEEAISGDVILSALNHLLKASLYNRLGLQKQMIIETQIVVRLLEHETSIEAILLKAKAYYYLSLNSNVSLSDKNAAQCQSLLNKITDINYLRTKRIYLFISYYYNARGEIFMERKNLDSAQYYLSKAYQYSFKEDCIPKNTFLESLGFLNEKKGNTAKALEYYLKSLDETEQFDKEAFARNGPGLLKKIYTIYEALGDRKNYNLYYQRYIAENEKFIHHLNTEVLVTAGKIVDKNEFENKNEIQKQSGLLIVVVIIALAVLVGIFCYHSKIQKKKDLVIRHKETTLFEIEQKANLLSLKVEDTLNEVIEAAKNNRQEFWPMFQKLYPDFSVKLLSVSPDIKTSELVLCAYAFLGFTTKDIAVYTFKAVQTVKNNKHNLRKRLQIPPKQDLNVWLRDFYQN